MGKHKPPSRERYEENNPNWTVRLTLNLYNALQEFLKKTGYSRRSFIRMALGKMKMNFERIKDEAYTKGIDDGERNGYTMGELDGYNNGWQQGYIDGQKKGNEEGYTTGYSEGLKRGKKEGFDEGAEYIYEQTKDQNKIWYQCVVCGEPIVIKPNSPEHLFIIDMMRLNGWKHSGCANWGDPYL